MFCFFVVLFFFMCPFLQAEQAPKCPSNFVYGGPEVYYVERLREGGSKQTGTLSGGRLGYERIKRLGFYVGLEGSYAQGRMRGKDARGRSNKSTMVDAEVEARGGFTFQSLCFLKPSITPYGGFGYLSSTNQFINPSPMLIKFEDSYEYFSLGFLSSISPSKRTQLGVNFKIKFTFNGQGIIRDIPGEPDARPLMTNMPQYVVELPFKINYKDSFALYLVPFYQFRHFGGRENHPYDFIDTQFQIAGARVLLGLVF
jgi:hypothetical protein